MNWQSAFSQAFNIVQPALVALLTGMLVALAHAAFKRIGVSIDEKADARLAAYAEQAALLVEEVVAAAVKRGEARPTDVQKLQMAAEVVVDKLAVPPDVARRAVLATLPTLPGIGAVKP